MSGEICKISVLEYNVCVLQDYFFTFIFSLLYTNYLLLSIIVFQLYLFVLENSALYVKVVSITMSTFLFIFWLSQLGYMGDGWTARTVDSSNPENLFLETSVAWFPDYYHLWIWNYYKSQNWSDHQGQHLDYPDLQLPKNKFLKINLCTLPVAQV